MGRRAWVAAAVAVGLGGCAGGMPADVAVGQIEEPGNTQVPLPPGQWTRLAGETATAGRVLGGGITNAHSVQAYYARVESGRIVQMVFVSTSEGGPHPNGYGAGGDCLRDTPNDFRYVRDVRSGTPNAVDCMQIIGARVFNAPRATSTAAYRAAYEAAQGFGGLPRFATSVEFAQAHSERFETYYLYDFPDQAPAATRVAEWRADRLTPGHRAYVDRLTRWATGFREAVRLGTEHRL